MGREFHIWNQYPSTEKTWDPDNLVKLTPALSCMDLVNGFCYIHKPRTEEYAYMIVPIAELFEYNQLLYKCYIIFPVVHKQWVSD